jgi:hypothetical protein
LDGGLAFRSSSSFASAGQVVEALGTAVDVGFVAIDRARRGLELQRAYVVIEARTSLQGFPDSQQRRCRPRRDASRRR